MDDLISRQAAIDALYHVDEYNGRSIETIKKLPSAQSEPLTDKTDIKAVYERGRIQGHVEMRTELLMQLKEIVGDEVWKNI